MPFPITRGLGSLGDGSLSALLTTSGYGSPGASPSPCPGFSLLALNVYVDHLDLVFSTNVALSAYALNPGNWSISTLTSYPMSVVSVSAPGGPTVTLGVTEGQSGSLYTLHMPLVGINDLSSNPYPGPYVQNFYAVGVGPAIQIAFAPDGINVQCIFNEPVLASEAVIAANYVITGSGGLTVYSVVQETANSYLLSTSQQTPGASYLLTVSNIHDLHGNPI